jgi:TatA/E family protein of Tat protein translocase
VAWRAPRVTEQCDALPRPVRIRRGSGPFALSWAPLSLQSLRGGPDEILNAMKALEIILLIVLVAFGTGKLRSAGSDLAAAVRGFRSALRAPADPPRPASPPAPVDPRPDAEFAEARARRPREGA